MAQLAQGLGFYLSNPFPGYVELLAHFLQRVVGIHVDTETHTQHLGFAAGQPRQYFTGCFLQALAGCGIHRGMNGVVLDEVAQVGIFIVADRRFHGNRFLGDLQDLADLVPDQPFLLLESSALRTYVAQSGLIGPDGIDASGQRAQYISLGTTTNGDGSDTLTLAWAGNRDDGLQVFKRFTANDGRYFVDVDYTITNAGPASASMTPFAQLKRDNTEAPNANVGFGVSPYLGAALRQPVERYTKLSFSDLADGPFAKQLPAGWVAILQHYFVSAWIPAQDESHDYFASRLSNGDNVIGFKNPSITIAPGETTTVSQRLYVGPKDQVALADLAENLDLVIDYGWLW